MSTRIIIIVASLLGVFLSISQIMLAKASRAMFIDKGLAEYIKQPNLLLRWDLFLAVLMYGVATLAYMLLLTKSDVVLAYSVMLSFALIGAYIFSYLLLGEPFSSNKLVGVLIICVGLWVLVS